jgi:hypothetical protein
MDRSIDRGASLDAGAETGSTGESQGGQAHVPHEGGTDAPFEIDVDVGRRFLGLTVRGQWDDAVFEAYAEAYRRAIATLRAHGGVRYVLTDASGYGVLTPELSERTAALVRAVGAEPSERGAIVTTSIVNQAQSREICQEKGTRFFRTVERARAWLFSDEA